MTPITLGLILFSVLLSATSQVLLKFGMSSPAVQAALLPGSAPLPAALAVASSPQVVGGLACFGLSAVVWLLVLSKIDVSQAYPFVALGTILTVAAGILVLGEPASALRMAGVGVIALGVVLVGLS
jgi:multidrug transporter EmrE-like cation transporter